jgi:hypothetical protein
MVKRIVDPPFLTKPEFEKWLTKAEKEIEKIRKAISEKKATPALRESIWQDFKKRVLRFTDNGRCVYCEGLYEPGAFSDAEHYAPKGMVTQDRQEVNHPGYYWLAYEWQNLLLSCKKCNSKHEDLDNNCSHDGKFCEFPVAKRRSSHPCDDSAKWWENLLAEDPLLFHPYYDNPEEHFKAGKMGVLCGKTQKGRVTVEICHLNRRELRSDRIREEEKAHYRAKSLASAVRSGADARTEWFSSGERYATYLNSILRALILQEIKNQEKQIAKLKREAARKAQSKPPRPI